MTSPVQKRAFLITASAFLATACSSSAPSSTSSLTSPNSPSASASPLRSGESVTEGEWRRFEVPELGISFEFRPGTGTVRYAFEDAPDDDKPCADGGPPGAIASWRIDFPEGSNSSGNTFAWLVSEGFGPDSHETGLAFDRWIEASNGTPRVVFCGKPDLFQTFGTFDLQSGARALIFAPGRLGNPPFDERERAAIVNFPVGYSDRFHSINFSFWPPGDATPAEMERVVRSVRFDKVAKQSTK